MSDDNIFKEVDEDLRHEEMLKLWDKYGVIAIAVAVLIVVSVGGYNGYSWWQAKRAAEVGTTFHQAEALVIEKKSGDALAAFAEIAKTAPGGYKTLSTLEMAAIETREGRKQKAVELYDQVAASSSDASLRDFAKIQAATLLLDEADAKEISRRVEGLNIDNNPWRYSARELLGLAAFRSGNMTESVKMFGQVVGDPSSPAEISQRAGMMLALAVKSQTPGAADGTPAPKPVTQ